MRGDKGAAGQRACAQRAGVGARAGGGAALRIAEEGFGMSEKPVREQDRLGVLQVRRTGHRDAEVTFGERHETGHHGAQRLLEIGSGELHEHSELGGDHFIAAAAGVQLGAERAEFFDQRRFNEVMDVFRL